MYYITDYTKRKASENGYNIKPSTNKNKKIDVFIGDKKIASIGSYGMSDFPTYIRTHGIEYANNRRRLYYVRHTKNTLNENLAKLLLW